MKRLIIDMDDVLADTSARIIELFNERNRQNVTKDFFYENDFYKYTKQGKFIPYREELYKPGFFANLEVFPNAIKVVEKLNKKYDIYIVSAATEFPNSLIEKVDWMAKYFPFISWRKIVLCGSKSIIKGDIMIDDHSRNFSEFEGRKLLFHAPHNYNEKGFERVKSWLEIEELLG